MASERARYEPVARMAARVAGIDQDLFIRQIAQESGFNPEAYNNGSGATGIAQIIRRFHPGVDPTDPVASLNYAADWMGRLYRQYGSYQKALMAYNWGPGNLMTWNGHPSGMPAETRHYLDVILGPGWPEPGAPSVGTPSPVYDPNYPITTQDHDWDCAQQSTLWAMKAYGRNPSNAWMEASMLTEGVESTEVGLTDGSGAGLAQWITDQYGEFGYAARNASPVNFDDVRSVAGTCPVMIGGHGWGTSGHWSGVRSYDASNGRLILANPAGTGPIYGQPSLSRQEFVDRGAWSMVIVTHASMGVPVPPEAPPAADPRDARIAELEAQVAAFVNAVAYLGDDIGDKVQAAVDELRRVRNEAVGARP